MSLRLESMEICIHTISEQTLFFTQCKNGFPAGQICFYYKTNSFKLQAPNLFWRKGVIIFLMLNIFFVF